MQSSRWKFNKNWLMIPAQMTTYYQSLTQADHFARHFHLSPFSSCLCCYAGLHSRWFICSSSKLRYQDVPISTLSPWWCLLPLLSLGSLTSVPLQGGGWALWDWPHHTEAVSHLKPLASFSGPLERWPLGWSAFKAAPVSNPLLAATHEQVVVIPCWSHSHRARGFLLL